MALFRLREEAFRADFRVLRLAELLAAFLPAFLADFLADFLAAFLAAGRLAAFRADFLAAPALARRARLAGRAVEARSRGDSTGVATEAVDVDGATGAGG